MQFYCQNTRLAEVSHNWRSQLFSLIYFYPPKIKIFPRIQVGICCSPVRAELSLALKSIYIAHRMYFSSFSIKGAVYTFYLIFSAVGMSNSWRRGQNIGLYPFSCEFDSHGVIFALQCFLFMALWILNSSLSWPSSSRKAESSLSPSSAWSWLVRGLCRRWDLQGEKCPVSHVSSYPWVTT